MAYGRITSCRGVVSRHGSVTSCPGCGLWPQWQGSPTGCVPARCNWRRAIVLWRAWALGQVGWEGLHWPEGPSCFPRAIPSSSSVSVAQKNRGGDIVLKHPKPGRGGPGWDHSGSPQVVHNPPVPVTVSEGGDRAKKTPGWAAELGLYGAASQYYHLVSCPLRKAGIGVRGGTSRAEWGLGATEPLKLDFHWGWCLGKRLELTYLGG